MKTYLKIATSLVGGLVLSLAATVAFAQVVTSKHDLTAAGGAQQKTSATDEVCVFCHTPHGSDVNAPVPLWNKKLSIGGSYTMYSTLQTPTLDGTEATVGSVSLACLSCHDGTQAMDVVINMPGSGGWNAAGAEISGTDIGIMTGSPVPLLGTDLTNDHPISIQYGGGGADSLDADGTFVGTLGDPDFNLPEKATVNSQPIWWVDSAPGTTGTREKTDMILYARDDLAGIQPFVECGSCHDPHNSSSFEANKSVAFLRIKNTSSQICTACHAK